MARILFVFFGVCNCLSFHSVMGMFLPACLLLVFLCTGYILNSLKRLQSFWALGSGYCLFCCRWFLCAWLYAGLSWRPERVPSMFLPCPAAVSWGCWFPVQPARPIEGTLCSSPFIGTMQFVLSCSGGKDNSFLCLLPPKEAAFVTPEFRSVTLQEEHTELSYQVPGCRGFSVVRETTVTKSITWRQC